MPHADPPADVQLTALLETIEDAIYTTDLDSTVTSWNAAAEQLYGFSAAEAIGRSILFLFPSERVDDEAGFLKSVVENTGVRDVEIIRRRRDGTAIPVSLTVAPLRDATGTPVGTIRIARDISRRQHAERAARRLAAIVESSDDAIIGKDLNGIVTSWNGAAQVMFGYTAAEMIGRSIRVLIPADRQDEEDHVLGSIRAGRKVDHFDTIRQRKDGTLVPISLTVSPIKDDDGRVVGASKIARDISERRRSERERTQLLAIAEENAAITEKLNEVGAIVASALDRTDIVQAVTDTGTDLTTAEVGAFFYNVIDEQGESYTLYTISGAPRELLSQFSMPRNTQVFDATFKGTGVMRSEDITQDPRYGRNAPFHSMPAGHLPIRSYLAVPVKSRAGEVLGGLFFGHSKAGVFNDRHERLAVGVASWAAVALENARLYADVQSANRLKDEFLATLSHELRTPLNAILGYTRMIRSGLVGAEKQAKAFATIERNAASLTQIVEDVLDVSRIISGKLRLNVQRIDVSSVVRNAIEAVMPAADAKGIRVDAQLGGADQDPVSADPERLQQVVWNLLSNAVKFTDRAGQVTIRLSVADGYVEILVTDTGIGIRPDFLPHMFERFRQADSSTTRERGGLGLGLAIARQLVEMHGGMIDVSSEGLGRGSTFRVRLPSARARTAPEEPKLPTPAVREPIGSPMPDLHSVRVLVVDDDRDALNMLQEMLEAAGAQVWVADSASSALETIESLHPDVLVADLGMPRMDGFELISRVRQSGIAVVRDVPAIAVTAYARSEDRAKALRAGFNRHLSKPIDPGELLVTVASFARVAIRPILPSSL
jgi:PAS domain S-box-containing protein